MATVIRGEADTRLEDLFGSVAEGANEAFQIRQKRREVEERSDTFLAFIQKAREGGLADEEILQGAFRVTNDPIAGFQLGNQMIKNNNDRRADELRHVEAMKRAGIDEANAKVKRDDLEAKQREGKKPEKIDIFNTKNKTSKKVFVPQNIVSQGPEAIDNYVTEKFPGFDRDDPDTITKTTPSDLLVELVQKRGSGQPLDANETVMFEMLTRAISGDPIDELLANKIREQFPNLGKGKLTSVPVDDKQQDAVDTEPQGVRDGTAPPSVSGEDGTPLSLLTIADDRLAQMTQPQIQAMFDALDLDNISDKADSERIVDIAIKYNIKL